MSESSNALSIRIMRQIKRVCIAMRDDGVGCRPIPLEQVCDILARNRRTVKQMLINQWHRKIRKPRSLVGEENCQGKVYNGSALTCGDNVVLPGLIP